MNSIGLDTQESAFMEDIANMTSRTSGRRGAVKSSETKKLAKVWPKMGSLEWLTVKQVRRGGGAVGLQYSEQCSVYVHSVLQVTSL